jgi:hypothetical protein
MVWPLGVAVKMREIWTSFLPRKKTSLSGVCRSLIIGGEWKWMGELVEVFCSAIQLACANSPVFEVENKIEKLVCI